MIDVLVAVLLWMTIPSSADTAESVCSKPRWLHAVTFNVAVKDHSNAVGLVETHLSMTLFCPAFLSILISWISQQLGSSPS